MGVRKQRFVFAEAFALLGAGRASGASCQHLQGKTCPSSTEPGAPSGHLGLYGARRLDRAFPSPSASSLTVPSPRWSWLQLLLHTAAARGSTGLCQGSSPCPQPSGVPGARLPLHCPCSWHSAGHSIP